MVTERNTYKFVKTLNNYEKYRVEIYAGDDPMSAAAKAEWIKARFPGIDCTVVPGDPCGITNGNAEGPDMEVCKKITDWINSAG